MQLNKLTVNWIFFLLSLGLAFFYANRGMVKSNTSILLDNIRYRDFESLTYRTQKYQIKIFERQKGSYWAKYEQFQSLKEPGKKENAEGDLSEDSSQVSTSQQIIESSMFKLTPDVDALIRNWANLQIEKNIGKSDQLDLVKFGLKDSEDLISIADTKGNTSQFIIGQQSFKSPFMFVKDVKHMDILLISKDLIDGLVLARSKFFQSEMLAGDELDRLTVESFGIVDEVKAELQKVTQDGKEEKIWRHLGKEADKNTDIWVNKLFSLRIREYQDLSEEALGEKYEPTMLIETFSGDKRQDTLRVYKTKKKEGHDYWISSASGAFVARLVTSRIETLLSDFKSNFQKH